MRMAFALFAGIVAAQAQVTFEAASIKPSTAQGEGTSFDRTAGMLRVRNGSLQDCIREAYGVGDAQILGQTWLKPDRYDIVAKMPLEARQNQRPAMLQALLAERFKLAVHREIREMPVYALVVAKGGLKIQPVEAGSGGLTGGSGKLMAKAVPLSRLAGYLAGPRLQLGHPVIDRTGISESFSFTLEYTPEDLFAALQEQLGLKLEPSKGMVDVIIVDHAEKPSEN